MLDTIRCELSKQSEMSFESFYQSYIMKLQDEIIERDLSKASRNLSSIEDVVELIKGLNRLEEELRTI